jgi:DNA-binding MarR family transcriptional regulator
MPPDHDNRRMIGALLRIPFQAIVTRIHHDLQMAGFTDLRPAHFAVFQHIRPEGSRLTELAEQAQMTKQSMGYLVNHLETCGYVERVPDPSDHRARIVCLTKRGWDVDRAARASVAQIEKEWADQIGEGRLAQLRQTLAGLAEFIAERKQ